MLYAKVVLGLHVEGPFDYIVLPEMEKRIRVGSRVKISFGYKKMIGYVVGLSTKTKIRKLKALTALLDEQPVLDKNMLSLAKWLSEYYCCSWGEAIETALPQSLRKGKKLAVQTTGTDATDSLDIRLKAPCPHSRSLLVHDFSGHHRWELYLEHIKQALDNKKSVIILLPDIKAIDDVKNRIEKSIGVTVCVLYRKEAKEIDEWAKIKDREACLVIGSRSSIFAPVKDLGLVIIDEEENSVYKQDQVPHYHVRDAALKRAEIENAKVILGSVSPSLESFKLVKEGKLEYQLLKTQGQPAEIKIMDMRSERRQTKDRKIIFSKYLADTVFSSISAKEKVLLFLNRKGFATFSSCHNCGKVIRCPRCNVNLVYHFDETILRCHYCNFKMDPPKICPACNAGYIKFSGAGTERIESEVHRLFPQARIKRVDALQQIDGNEADIFVATSSILKHEGLRFDLTGVLDIDNSLNRVDFRSTEKAFSILSGLVGLTNKKVIVQTSLPANICFKAIVENKPNLFYEEELKERKQLDFPPVKHFILVKCRSKKEERAKDVAQRLFEHLQKNNKSKSVKILSFNPGHPAKLRGNYYWNVLISTSKVEKAVSFLKLSLKDIKHSGIIVTVDVDPI